MDKRIKKEKLKNERSDFFSFLLFSLLKKKRRGKGRRVGKEISLLYRKEIKKECEKKVVLSSSGKEEERGENERNEEMYMNSIRMV